MSILEIVFSFAFGNMEFLKLGYPIQRQKTGEEMNHEGHEEHEGRLDRIYKIEEKSNKSKVQFRDIF
jgi:hypothetical protein